MEDCPDGRMDREKMKVMFAAVMPQVSHMLMVMVMMTMMMMMMMMVMMVMVMMVMLVIPLDHGVVDWAAVGQEKGVAEVFHL